MIGQDKIFYALIFLCASAVLGVAFWSLNEVRFSEARLTIPPGEVPKFEEKRTSRDDVAKVQGELDRLDKAAKKGDRMETFSVSHTLYQNSPSLLLEEYRQTKSPNRRYHLLKALSDQRNPKLYPFFKHVYRTERIPALRRQALAAMGFLRPDITVDLIEVKIFTSTKRQNLVENLYGVQVLSLIKNKNARRLMGRIAENHLSMGT